MQKAGLPVALALTVLGVACPPAPEPPPRAAWAPGTVVASVANAAPAAARGLRDVRGLVHSHSALSHDACDGAGVDENGVLNEPCVADFRRGVCQVGHDFVFLTDHGDRFTTTSYPDTLLYRPDQGDVLVERDVDGALAPTANRVACDDGRTVLVMAGTETGLMPVGIEAHVSDDVQARGAVYGGKDQASADALRAKGAVVLLAHPEEYSVDELKALPVDGFEMYNLHRNTVLGAGVALEILLRANDGDLFLPHPDLLVMAIVSEDPDYLERWGRVLASGKRVVTTMGTDCHQNTFRTVMSDGERGDSYRRMMVSFSNHLLVRPNADGTIDDAVLKEALARGRLYGAFEMLGYPRGFDVVAEASGATFELGDEAPVGASITARTPSVVDLDESAEAPVFLTRILRAVDSAEGFVEVARGDGVVTAVADVAGAYRVEVRMVPLHLRAHLGNEDGRLLDDVVAAGGDYVWLYANPIYVR